MTEPLILASEEAETLDYYLDFQPGEDEFLDSLVENHGHYLQTFTKREKLFILAALANSVSFESPGVIDDKAHQFWQECYSKMSPNDLLGLMGALCEQIRWGHYAETTTEQDLQAELVHEN